MLEICAVKIVLTPLKDLHQGNDFPKQALGQLHLQWNRKDFEQEGHVLVGHMIHILVLGSDKCLQLFI